MKTKISPEMTDGKSPRFARRFANAQQTIPTPQQCVIINCVIKLVKIGQTLTELLTKIAQEGPKTFSIISVFSVICMHFLNSGAAENSTILLVPPHYLLQIIKIG